MYEFCDRCFPEECFTNLEWFTDGMSLLQAESVSGESVSVSVYTIRASESVIISNIMLSLTGMEEDVGRGRGEKSSTVEKKKPFIKLFTDLHV